MRKIDLHCHSTASDGLYTPYQLVEAATKAKVSVLSLTDHDTMVNVNQMAQLCKEASIQFIPGIELSCWNGLESIHILGYFKDDAHNKIELQQTLKSFQERRRKRAHLICQRLKEYHQIEINLNNFDLRDGASIGRANLAKMIGDKYNLSKDEIFAHYLGDHSRAFIPSSDMDPKEGIRLLNRAGALAILAHPGELRKTSFSQIFSLDFDGAECYYPNHTPQRTQEFVKACLAKKRFITCGSDDHGIANDQKHGKLGTTSFSQEHLEPFLAYMGVTTP